MFAQNKKLIEMEDSDQLERTNLAYILHKWTVATVQVDILHTRLFARCKRIHVANRRPSARVSPHQTFLDYWDKNIDGPIKEVFIYDQGGSEVRMVDRKFKMN